MKHWRLVFLPAGVGLASGLLWQQSQWPNPIFFSRIDFGSFLCLLGLAVSLAWAAGQATWRLAWNRCEHGLARHDQEQAALHRRFIRRLDHELKNRLTAIRAALINLPQEGNGKAIGEMRTEVNRLVRLSTELRKLNDLEAQPIEQEAVDLAALLAELLGSAQQRPESASRHIELRLPRVPWPLPPVAGDRDLLFLALHNLVDNSIKFCRPGDSIEIRTFEDGPFITVEVADTGPGIHPEDLPHLGEELFRGRTTREVEGSGLGLALVQTIVERHSGMMSIRSRLDQGTVVAVRFPAARPGQV